VAAGVGGDDGLVLGHGGVEVDVVGEGDLDDPVDAAGCVRPDGADRVGLIQGDGLRDRGGVHLRQIAALADRPDDGRAAPVGELRGHGPTPPSTPRTRIVRPATGPSAKLPCER